MLESFLGNAYAEVRSLPCFACKDLLLLPLAFAIYKLSLNCFPLIVIYVALPPDHVLASHRI